MENISFERLPFLLLLPLVLLPLIRHRSDTLSYSWTTLLPQDSVGKYAEWLWRILAFLSLLAVIVGLASPGRSETSIEHIGTGAEISIVMDRSSSMDAFIHRNGANPGKLTSKQDYVAVRIPLSKNDVLRKALGWLLTQRPNNRYALTLFNSAAMRVTPFTDDVAIVQSALDASDIGRGPSKTNMGQGLLAAIEAFEGRDYTGSRVIMLVSDGGAKLDQETRQAISDGLRRNRISLYFIYIESSPNSPNLELVGTDVDSSLEEVALHVFFKGLDVEYQVFQAADPDSLTNAVKSIDAQQNLPLTYLERIPREDYSRAFFVSALILCGLLLLLSMTQKVNWL